MLALVATWLLQFSVPGAEGFEIRGEDSGEALAVVRDPSLCEAGDFALTLPARLTADFRIGPPDRCELIAMTQDADGIALTRIAEASEDRGLAVGSAGRALAWVGDIDRDGAPDFVARSRVLLTAFSGRTGEMFWRRVGFEREELENATIADRDGDGVRELVLQDRAWIADRPGPQPTVWSGATGLDLSGGELGVDLRAKYGVAELGDLDRDGFGELALIAERIVGEETRELSLVVLSGYDLSERDRIPIGAAGGHDRRSWLSRGDAALATLGDVNGDGIAEVVIGRVVRDRHSRSADPCVGYTEVFDVRAGHMLWQRESVTRVEDFSCLVSPGAEVDGDGIPDVLVREWVTSSRGVPGRLVLRSGCDGTQIREHLAPEGGYAEFPQAAEFVRDVDGDGVADYVVTMDVPEAFRGTKVNAILHSGRTGEELLRFS